MVSDGARGKNGVNSGVGDRKLMERGRRNCR